MTADIGKAKHSDLWHYEQALSEIKEMLESQLGQKKGKWINNRDVSWMCSECGKWLDVLQGDVKMNFCPNCGAAMRESFTIPTEIIESVIGYDD